MKTFVTSDPHFGHWGVCKFLKYDNGPKLRPWDDPAVMDEALIENWNAVVGPKDKVYVLGDIFINRKHKNTIAKCNGDKVLIKGNHDIFKLEDYLPNFRDIRAYHVLNNCILSHIPVHTSQLQRFHGNVHGHTHWNLVLDDDNKIDRRYYNVCTERTNFVPVNIEAIFEYFRKLKQENDVD